MIYEFKCKKQNCRLEFEVSLPLEIHAKFRDTEPPFYDVRCPRCFTKAPNRHYKAASIPAVHIDTGTWDHRTAPTALAGKHYHSKDEKEQQIQHVLGDNYGVADVDRDLTAKPKGVGTVTKRAADAVVPKTPLNAKQTVIRAFLDAGGPMRIADIAEQTGVSYARVYGVALKSDGFTKTAPGEFSYTAP